MLKLTPEQLQIKAARELASLKRLFDEAPQTKHSIEEFIILRGKMEKMKRGFVFEDYEQQENPIQVSIYREYTDKWFSSIGVSLCYNLVSGIMFIKTRFPIEGALSLRKNAKPSYDLVDATDKNMTQALSDLKKWVKLHTHYRPTIAQPLNEKEVV